MANLDGSKNNKRKVALRSDGAQPQKRRKGQASSAAARKSATRKANLPRQAVAVDSLQWQPVEIPEMLQDAEGFFGLEEVEGVEIVRNGNSVQFVTAKAATPDSDEFEGFDDEPVAKENGVDEADTARPGQEKTEWTAQPSTKATDAKAKDKKEKAAGNGESSEKPAKGKEAKGGRKEKEPEKAEKAGKEVKGILKKTPTAEVSEEDAELGSLGFSMLAGLDDEAGEDEADVAEWVPLQLAPPLLSCLAQLKFSQPTAIQAATIPEILAGHDVIGKAATGSGKTLAFSIPIVQKWLDMDEQRRANEANKAKTASTTGKASKAKAASAVHAPVALILSPTRELAHQITTHIRQLCAALPSGPYVCAVTGGLSVYKQQRQLEKADIVVGTPGRLWEVLSASKPLLEAFKRIRFLVVDEADRLLSDGRFKEAEEILEALDSTEVNETYDDDDDEADTAKAHPRQTLVFSATFNKGLQQKLAGKGRYDLMDQQQSMEHLLKRLNFHEEEPKFIDVNPVSQMAARLREGLVECGGMEKDLYLYALLMFQPTRRTLVFTNSISSVRRLLPFLQNLNIPAHALHSQMAQKARLRSVERFTAAQGDRGAVLIATDVAARGLDIPGIDVVIHYHVPRSAGDYVHRSGRTARAQKGGLSIMICGPEEVVPTRRLVAKIHAASSARKKKRDESEDKSEDKSEVKSEVKSQEEGKDKKGKGKEEGKDKKGKGKEEGKDKDKKTGPDKSQEEKEMSAFFIKSIDLDRRIVARLRDRVVLAKKIADSTQAKEKGNKDNNWLREAAEELGVDYDSDNLEQASSWSGRGSGRRSREKEARELSKAELASLRAQLKQLLAKRVNTGVSERYLTGGSVDIEALLRGAKGDFLGHVDGLDIDL